jgi:hypothetical protein
MRASARAEDDVKKLVERAANIRGQSIHSCAVRIRLRACSFVRRALFVTSEEGFEYVEESIKGAECNDVEHSDMIEMKRKLKDIIRTKGSTRNNR